MSTHVYISRDMDKKIAQRDILGMANDDLTGLWQVIETLQARWPKLTSEPARAKGRVILDELLDYGMVYLCHYDADTGEEHRIPREEAHKLLDAACNWDLPAGPKEQVRFACTLKGKKVMFALAAEMQDHHR